MKHLTLVVVLAAFAGCKDKPATKPPASPGPTATAVLEPRSGANVTGTLTFRTVGAGVEVSGTVEGLAPGDHGFHVHEYGDCTAPDATSAGGHFNPHGQPHGAPDADAHHAGDVGNLTAGDDGKATKRFVMKGVTLADDATSIVGKAFIVHEKADDLKTQPTGDAGGRVACGVIRLDAR